VAKREMRLEDVQSLLQKRCGSAGGQRAFAAKHGLKVQYVSQVLLGQRPPSARLCKVLGIKADGMRWIKE
jgi:DNA-binding transcriptional regulator YdaS (Cro superfamily)